MKLQNSFYSVITKETGAVTRFDIKMDASHFIYQAHFPGEPITPGVCIIQIAKELLELHLNFPLQICADKNVKFLHVISPTELSHVTYVFDKILPDETTNTFKAQVVIVSGETPLAKLSFTCKE